MPSLWLPSGLSLRVGDTVLSKDEHDAGDSIEPRRVTAVEVYTVYQIRLLEIEEADGTTGVLQTTDEHPFWVMGVGWVKAGELQVGQQFLTADGDLVTLSTTSSEEHPEGITVYNLTVEQDHTFFVSATSGDEMVWVHNQEAGTPDESHPTGPGEPALPLEDPFPFDSHLPGFELGGMNPSAPMDWQEPIDPEYMAFIEGQYQWDLAKQKYMADYAGLIPPKQGVPVLSALDRARYEYEAGHGWAAAAHIGVAGFEGGLIGPLAGRGVGRAPMTAPMPTPQPVAAPAAQAEAAAEASEAIKISQRNLQKIFQKHGTDLGLSGNWNASRAAEVERAITSHINDPAVQKIAGTYRGQVVTHCVNPSTGVNVIVDQSGSLIGAWKLGLEQLNSVLSSGRLF